MQQTGFHLMHFFWNVPAKQTPPPRRLSRAIPVSRGAVAATIVAAITIAGCSVSRSGGAGGGATMGTAIPDVRVAATGSAPDRTGIRTAPRFTEIGETAGLRYEWKIAGKRPLNILQTIGNGCAFLDYNRDDNLDVLLVGPTLALFAGDGKGAFRDVSVQAGLRSLKGIFSVVRPATWTTMGLRTCISAATARACCCGTGPASGSRMFPRGPALSRSHGEPRAALPT
jgi:hypothetical protein